MKLPLFVRLVATLIVITSFSASVQTSQAQTAQLAMDIYEEGPVWQIMTFRTPPGQTERHLRNIAIAWEHQLKLAQEMGFMQDYKILTKWAASPDDWNIMVIEIFPNMASYDSFWENWARVDAQTVDLPEFTERLKRRERTGTQFLGTIFAREVFLKPQ